MNEFVFNLLGVNGINETIDKVTDVFLIIALAIIAAFGITGVIQWVKRKNFKKIDPELRSMIFPLITLAAVWFIFEKLIILNYRPFLVNGIAESSFPSTHVLITTSALLMTIIVAPKYFKKKWLRALIDVVAVLLILAVGFGRILAGMHWATDVLGGLIFGLDIALIYGIILNRTKELEK